MHDRLIRLYGMRRSGNHAFITWLSRHFQDPVHLINNARSIDNPYVRGLRAISKHDWLDRHFARPRTLEEFQRARKTCLIVSYEDFEITQLTPESLTTNQYVLGGAQRVFDALILRDPFNLFASRLANPARRKTRPTDGRARAMWVAHGLEATGRTSYLGSEPVIISYNRWYADIGYRRELAARFGLHFTDAGIDHVPRWGDGSSFDGLDHDGRARQMTVLDRWQRVRDEPDFVALLKDEVLLELARELFPELTDHVLTRRIARIGRFRVRPPDG